MFAKIRKDQGSLVFTATDEAARDIEWLIGRYPMDCYEIRDGKEVLCSDLITAMARRFDERRDETFQILGGKYKPPRMLKMTLPPRDYQLQAAILCRSTGGLVLADALGTGKTVSGIALLSMEHSLPAIVVAPTHLQKHWKEQIATFLPSLKTHIITRTIPYALDKDGSIPDVLIMTYHKMHGWSEHLPGFAKTIIFDEAHELRRRGSKKYEAAQSIAESTERRLLLTATPIFNYGGEFFNVVSIARPDELGTRSEFIREWCTSGSGYISNDDKARILKPEAFGRFLREEGMMLRRTKKDIGRMLPPLSVVMETVESDSKVFEEEAGAAYELAQIILSKESSRKDRFTASGALDNSLRQATGIAKAPFVADFVRMIHEESEEPVLLFGWHRAVYDIWMERLADLNPVMFTGSESGKKKMDNLDKFMSGESKVLIMSLRSGSGVDGIQKVTSNVVFGELDWSYSVLAQGTGRVFRDGQKKPVFAYYPISEDGSDSAMVDILGIKRQQMEGVRDPDGPPVETVQVDPNHVRKLAESYVEKFKSKKR